MALSEGPVGRCVSRDARRRHSPGPWKPPHAGVRSGGALRLTAAIGHPQTVYGIADSPVGMAAWMLDHDQLGLQRIARAFDGEPTRLTRDDVLDNATLFWLTNTTISAARLCWEGFAKTDLGPRTSPSRLP